MRVKYYRYSGLLSHHLDEYARAVQSYQDAISLACIKWPPERIWAEDYYYLAASYAELEKESEAFQYLRKAIKKGWEMESLEKQTEWQPYRHNPVFIKIDGKLSQDIDIIIYLTKF